VFEVAIPFNSRISAISDGIPVILASSEFVEMYRKSPTDFTRTRKMSFSDLILYIIHPSKSSASIKLDEFFKLSGCDETMSQQSFSEARQKIKPEAFRYLFDYTVRTAYSIRPKTYHGMIPIAIDGTKINLPIDEKLLAHFGGNGAGATNPAAQGSCAYDMLNDA
jgi:hypothetical protein